jgi:hypothetical protein
MKRNRLAFAAFRCCGKPEAMYNVTILRMLLFFLAHGLYLFFSDLVRSIVFYMDNAAIIVDCSFGVITALAFDDNSNRAFCEGKLSSLWPFDPRLSAFKTSVYFGGDGRRCHVNKLTLSSAAAFSGKIASEAEQNSVIVGSVGAPRLLEYCFICPLREDLRALRIVWGLQEICGIHLLSAGDRSEQGWSSNSTAVVAALLLLSFRIFRSLRDCLFRTPCSSPARKSSKERRRRGMPGARSRFN